MQVHPSSISIPLHDPFGSGTHSHTLVALKIAKDSLARIYPATSGNDFFFPFESYFVSKDLMTRSVSLPKTQTKKDLILHGVIRNVLSFQVVP